MTHHSLKFKWRDVFTQLAYNKRATYKRSFASDGTASASRGARADASNKDDPRENDISRKHKHEKNHPNL